MSGDPMSPSDDAAQRRAELLDGWDEAARGWRRSADDVRRFGMPVSVWLVEHLALQPGQRILELAAGPGDTGFLAAELVAPGGTLISSDGSEKMLATARDRAGAQGIENVEFRQLQLEWIDLDTASVDAVLCRWGVMLVLDPEAAVRECRRVLRPGGRLAVAVWDTRERNPWIALAADAAAATGVLPPPDPTAPGPFSLSGEGQLRELLEACGFVDVAVDVVAIERRSPDFETYLDDTLDVSRALAQAWATLDDEGQRTLVEDLRRRVQPFTASDGTIAVPGHSLVAIADA